MHDKKGLMDDFTDLLSFTLIISMIGIFAMLIFHTDKVDKTELTLQKIVSLHGQEELLHLINAPAQMDTKEIVMKDVILSAVNTNDEALFTEKMQEYFEQHHLEGGVAVYDSASYGAEEEPESLVSYNNVAFLGKEKGALYLTNVNGEGTKKLVVVRLFG